MHTQVIKWHPYYDNYFQQDCYSVEIINNNNKYQYYILPDSPQATTYRLGLVHMMDAKILPKPQFHHKTLKSAFQCAAEHFIKYFTAIDHSIKKVA